MVAVSDVDLLILVEADEKGDGGERASPSLPFYGMSGVVTILLTNANKIKRHSKLGFLHSDTQLDTLK